MRKINISAVMKYIITINIHIDVRANSNKARKYFSLVRFTDGEQVAVTRFYRSHVLVDRSFRNRYIKTTKRYRNFRTSRLEIEIKLDE